MFHLALATAAVAVDRNVAGHVIQSFYNTNVFFDAQKHDSRTSRELLFGSVGDVTLFTGGKCGTDIFKKVNSLVEIC